MPTLAFDRYYRYAELTAILHAFAAEHPRLVAVESIGKSHEGRDIWVLTVTNTATGAASDKPAFWVDGNIHATEVAASAANLYFLHTLVTGYGTDTDVTRALDTRAFYICPRINPDGAEWALADRPKFIRSSTRPYPWNEEEIEALTVEDIDGNGRILEMRIPDPNGLWKEHPEAPGLMVRRDPVETGGAYYRILPEGALDGYDGYLLRPFEHQPDEEMHAEDLWFYQKTGEEGRKLTGYPAISVYHEFRYHPKSVIGGTFDWFYEHLGMYTWVVEIWSPMREAGIENYRFIDWFRDHPVEDDVKLYAGSRDKVGGIAHIAWRAFDHPQLGEVEIGGWNFFEAFGNPPPALLERELARFPRWLVWQALTSPRMELLTAEADALGDDTWRVRLVVHTKRARTWASSRARRTSIPVSPPGMTRTSPTTARRSSG